MYLDHGLESLSKNGKNGEKEDSNPECAICYEELNSKSLTQFKPCLHLVCFECASQIKKKSKPMQCPLCRTWIDNKKPKEKKLTEPQFGKCFYVGILFIIIFAGFGATVSRILNNAMPTKENLEDLFWEEPILSYVWVPFLIFLLLLDAGLFFYTYFSYIMAEENGTI